MYIRQTPRFKNFELDSVIEASMTAVAAAGEVLFFHQMPFYCV